MVEMGHLEIVKALLAAGVDANAVIEGSAAPLHIAAEEGNLEIVKALLEAGVEADKVGKASCSNSPSFAFLLSCFPSFPLP
jgi:cytohesin